MSGGPFEHEPPFEVSGPSVSEERLVALIALLGIERLEPVLATMDEAEARTIRELGNKAVNWEVLEATRTELAMQLRDEKDAHRFERPGEYWA